MSLSAGSGIAPMLDLTLLLREGFNLKSMVVVIRSWHVFSSRDVFIIEVGLARFGGTGKGEYVSRGDMKTSLSQPRVGLSGRIYGSGRNSKNSGRPEKDTFFLGFTHTGLASFGGESSSEKNVLVRGDDAVLLSSDVLEPAESPGELGRTVEAADGVLVLSVMFHSAAAIKASASA